MNESSTSEAAAAAVDGPAKPQGQVISIDEGLIKDHLNKVVVTTVEETLRPCWMPRPTSSAARIEETLQYYQFPSEHWRSLRTNNPLERLMREIRRRTRAIGAFPDGNSALILVSARLSHVVGTRWGRKRYMDMDHLRALDRDREAKERTAATA